MSNKLKVDQKTEINFKPRILALVCNWHSFKGKELDINESYNANIKFIRVICSSRIDRAIILKVVEEKIDGIIIIACSQDNCHYLGGTDIANNRIKHTVRFLKNVGYEEERILLNESPEAEKADNVDFLSTFVEKIINLGPFR